MKKKKRKLKIFRLLIVLLLLILIIIGILYIFNLANSLKNKETFKASDLNINELDYSFVDKLDIDLYSDDYLLIRLNDFKVLYANNNTKQIYPASLTKVLTMDVVLANCSDINETSSISDLERELLIEENASLAGIDTNTPYTIDELLYGLILPSGADAAKALENYVTNKDLDLVELMNDKCHSLNLKNSNFTNTTGLHDDNLYTTLDDYSKIVIDALQNYEAKKILKTRKININGDNFVSTLTSLMDRDDDILVYGGKTGYTLEAGMNIMVLYEVDNRSYMLILADAQGSPYEQAKHIEDVNNIFDYLYN